MAGRKAQASTVAHETVQTSMLGELIDNAEIGALVVTEGRYVAVNRYACAALGYTREELIGKHVGELNPDSDLPAHYAEIEAGRRSSGELTIRRADGAAQRVQYRVARTTLGGLRVLIGFFWLPDENEPPGRVSDADERT